VRWKIWLFNVTPEGARATATFYSLIETAKANGFEPSKYLRYLLEKFPHAKTSEDVFNLLPMNISKIELKSKIQFSIMGFYHLQLSTII